MTIEKLSEIFKQNRSRDDLRQNDSEIELADLAEGPALPLEIPPDDFFRNLLRETRETLEKNQRAVEKTFEQAKQNLKKTAKALNDPRLMAAFGVLDGLNLGHSTLSYGLGMDALRHNANANMHDWLASDTGMISAALLYPVLLFYSALGSYWDDKDESVYKAVIAKTWPYVRDILKAGKNAYKGTQSLLNALRSNGLFSSTFLKAHMIYPLALGLGIISILNRVLYRYMLGDRKEKMSANSKLFNEISRQGWLTNEEVKRFQKLVGRQSMEVRAAAITSAAFSGMVNSLYLFFGVFTLAAFTGPLFFVLLSCSLLYSLINIGCQIYEEQDYQHQLVITGAQIEFELFQKEHGEELETTVKMLQDLLFKTYETPVSPDIDAQIQILKRQRDLLVLNFIDAHQKYKDTLGVTRLSAVFGGLKNGLSAQNAAFSLMFGVATLALVFGGTFVPLPFLLVCSLAGLVFLTIFLKEAWDRNTSHREALVKAQLDFSNQILDDSATLLESRLKDLNDSQNRPKIQEGFEIVRTGAQGFAKGVKSIEFSFNYLMTTDEDGHNQDSPVMIRLMYLASVVHGLIFALRNFARGFGRDPLFNPDEKPKDTAACPAPRPEPSTREFGILPEPEPDSREVPGSDPQLPSPSSNLPSAAFTYYTPYTPAFYKNPPSQPFSQRKLFAGIYPNL